MDYQSVSAILIKSLDLASPPVALAFVDAATGKASAGEAAPAPSSCSFWRNAEAGLFFCSRRFSRWLSGWRNGHGF